MITKKKGVAQLPGEFQNMLFWEEKNRFLFEKTIKGFVHDITWLDGITEAIFLNERILNASLAVLADAANDAG